MSEKETEKHGAEQIEHKNELLNRAIIFATEKHSGQLRKGSALPYILHPLEALQILYSMRADTELMIAGVLHDTVEDTGTTPDEIRELFGGNVAELVASNSEDKSKTWTERKSHTVRELKNASQRVKMLVLADKLSNIRSIATDYKSLGDRLWKRFNAPKEKQAWYYNGIQDALYGMQYIPGCADAYGELVRLFKEVFVKFYYDRECQVIYQLCDDGSGLILKKGRPSWNELSEQSLRELEKAIDENDTAPKFFDGYGILRSAELITREYAEKLEDCWKGGLR